MPLRDRISYEIEEDHLTGDLLLYRVNLVGQRWGITRYHKDHRYLAQQVCDFMNAHTPYEV
jgi:hypothetical protein